MERGAGVIFFVAFSCFWNVSPFTVRFNYFLSSHYRPCSLGCLFQTTRLSGTAPTGKTVTVTAVGDPGEEPGGLATPALFLDQTEAQRAEKFFWRPDSPLISSS